MKRALVVTLLLCTICIEGRAPPHPAQKLVENIRNTAKWFSTQLKRNRNLYNDEENEPPSYTRGLNRGHPDCTPEEAIEKLRDHITSRRPLEELQRTQDRCLSKYFREHFGSRESRHRRDRERDSPRDYSDQSHRDHRDERAYVPGYNKRNGRHQDMYCEYPNHKNRRGECRSPHEEEREEKGGYHPSYGREKPNVVYSIRNLFNKGKDVLNNAATNPYLNDIKDKILNSNNRPNDNPNSNPNENSHDNGYNNGYNGYNKDSINMPMYCMLAANKIVPYIIAYGPPDERKRRIFINFRNESMRGQEHENNPLRRLNIFDTVLSSPLTFFDLSNLVTRIEKLSTFTKIVHIAIHDTPIIRIEQEQLLHPMCTEGSLCLAKSQCTYSSREHCEKKDLCVSPTTQSFIASLPKAPQGEKTVLTVYNSRNKEFSIERIFIEQKQVENRYIEYTDLEAPLQENAPICRETVKIIENAIIESKTRHAARERRAQIAFIIESNNTRGFIIFLLIKQILDSTEQHYIDDNIKNHMSNTYLSIFREEVGKDLVESTVRQDISTIVSILNESRNPSGQHHRMSGNYNEDYGRNSINNGYNGNPSYNNRNNGYNDGPYHNNANSYDNQRPYHSI